MSTKWQTFKRGWGTADALSALVMGVMFFGCFVAFGLIVVGMLAHQIAISKAGMILLLCTIGLVAGVWLWVVVSEFCKTAREKWIARRDLNKDVLEERARYKKARD